MILRINRKIEFGWFLGKQRDWISWIYAQLGTRTEGFKYTVNPHRIPSIRLSFRQLQNMHKIHKIISQLKYYLLTIKSNLICMANHFVFLFRCLINNSIHTDILPEEYLPGHTEFDNLVQRDVFMNVYKDGLLGSFKRTSMLKRISDESHR